MRASRFAWGAIVLGVVLTAVWAADVNGKWLAEYTTPDGQTRRVLCGEFKVGKAGAWTTFATVQTSPYEQWLGGGAEGFCKPPGFKPDPGGDLSDALARAVLAAPAQVSSAPAR